MAKQLMTVAEMQDRAKWLKYRNLGLGGSDAGVVCGLSAWKTPFGLWLEKTEQVEPEDISGKEYIYWGNVLEEVVAKEFCERTGKKVQRKGMMQSEEHPFMLASIDRAVVGENAILECKTANGYAAREWKGDNLPDAYYCQVQHYLAVTGCDKAYIACLIGGNHFVYKEIQRNEEDIKALIEAEEKFWEAVITKKAPQMDEGALPYLADKYADVIEAEPIDLPTDAEALIKEYDSLDDTIEKLEFRQDAIKAQLQEMMGRNEVGNVSHYRVTWRKRKGSSHFDSIKFKADHPDLAKQYTKEGKTFRVFSIRDMEE